MEVMRIYEMYKFGYDAQGRHITDGGLLDGTYWENGWRAYLSGLDVAADWLMREPGVMWC